MKKIKQRLSDLMFSKVNLWSFFLGVFVSTAYTLILPEIMGPVKEKPIWEQKADLIEACPNNYTRYSCIDVVNQRIPHALVNLALDKEVEDRKKVQYKPIWVKRAEMVEACTKRWFTWTSDCKENAERYYPDAFVKQAIDEELALQKSTVDSIVLPPQ